MRVRRYRGTLDFEVPWNMGDPARTRNVAVIVRDLDDGSREAAFDVVEPHCVYNVFARREGGAWSVRYKSSYKQYNEALVRDSAANSGMHIEGFQVDPRGDAATMRAVWIEGGIRYGMEYEGRLESDEQVEEE